MKEQLTKGYAKPSNNCKNNNKKAQQFKSACKGKTISWRRRSPLSKGWWISRWENKSIFRIISLIWGTNSGRLSRGRGMSGGTVGSAGLCSPEGLPGITLRWGRRSACHHRILMILRRKMRSAWSCYPDNFWPKMRYSRSKDTSTEGKTGTGRTYSKYSEESGITIPTRHYPSGGRGQNWPTIKSCRYHLTESKTTSMYTAS